MRVEAQILAALALDLVLGDPRWFPHPVKGMGRLALFLEGITRSRFKSERLAGIATAMGVIGTTVAAAALVLTLAASIHPWLGDVVSIILMSTGIAARDLSAHAGGVRDALQAGDLVLARQRVGMIVGRDTALLEEPEVARAAVESVAESIVDGVTAPLFFAFLGGPVAMMAYKAINTLDSTFGYKNERYLHFGWASARIDDAANYIPARLTAPLVAAASAVLGFDWRKAFLVLKRDGRKHPSPNSGLCEAAVAGALGVQLGGLNYYFGQPSVKPKLGDAIEPLSSRHVLGAVRLMWLACGFFVAVGLTVRLAVW
jgi:adenosylcobinamide-phosphate synthase